MPPPGHALSVICAYTLEGIGITSRNNRPDGIIELAFPI